MGALTELRDKYDSENSYWYAKDLYERYQGKTIPDYERQTFPEDLLFIDLWYDHFRGSPHQRFAYYIPWCFPDELYDSVDDIFTICDITDGVSCTVRPATEKDFFMFRPEEIDGDVLVISNDATYPPHILNLIFGNVRVKDEEHGNWMCFGW